MSYAGVKTLMRLLTQGPTLKNDENIISTQKNTHTHTRDTNPKLDTMTPQKMVSIFPFCTAELPTVTLLLAIDEDALIFVSSNLMNIYQPIFHH